MTTIKRIIWWKEILPILLSDKTATYKLFRYLHEDKFNGDIFTIDETKESIVCEDHLKLLQDLFRGKYLESGQMMLWPLYSFDVIPIELISNIYQQFFHYRKEKKEREKKGTYYTPYHLVAFLMDEVLPWSGKAVDKKILDPSCGSGVFLVEAYRRLIDRWMQGHSGKYPSFSDLKIILRKAFSAWT